MPLAAWVRAAVFLFSRDQNPLEESCCDLERSPGGSPLASRLEQKASRSAKPDAHTPRRDTTRGFYSRRLFARNNLRPAEPLACLPGQDKLVSTLRTDGSLSARATFLTHSACCLNQLNFLNNGRCSSPSSSTAAGRPHRRPHTACSIYLTNCGGTSWRAYLWRIIPLWPWSVKISAAS